MKTIRVLRSTGSHLPTFSEGQVAKVPDETADLLCGLDLAEVLEAVPDEPLEAIPENPSIKAAEEKLQEIKNRWQDGKGVNESPKPRRRQKSKLDQQE